MYVNYCEKPKGLGMITTVSSIPPEIKEHVRCLEQIVLSQLNFIGKQNETICSYEKKIEVLGKELEQSKRAGGCDDTTMPVVKNEEPDSSNYDTMLKVGNSVADVAPQPFELSPGIAKRYFTKCCGRSISKLSRSLKRRNWVLPDKSLSSKRLTPYSASSSPSISPSHVKNENNEEKSVGETNTTNLTQVQSFPVGPAIMNFKEPHKKHSRKPRIITWKDDFLCTDKPYFLPDYYAATSPLAHAETTIDVPSWRNRVYRSYYGMENTENLDDRVFQKRHAKYEAEEKRRKRKDVQKMCEMNVIIQKLHREQYCSKDSQGKLWKKSISLYPSPNDILCIEVTESLPVIAFGHLIPVFQPIEFSLPWSVADPMEVESPGKCKMIRNSVYRQKVT